MADFTRESQLNVRLPAPVRLEFERVVSALRFSGRVEVEGRKITREGVLSAVLLHVTRLPPAELERIVLAEVPAVEAMIRASHGERPSTAAAATRPKAKRKKA